MEDALEESEDSSKLNTAFIERLNLTIRQGPAYLNRRSPCHARKRRTLEDHCELLRCHHSLCRPHSLLRFGNEVRTPAMQAGLARRKLVLRDVFVVQVGSPCFVVASPWPESYQGRGVQAELAACPTADEGSTAARNSPPHSSMFAV